MPKTIITLPPEDLSLEGLFRWQLVSQVLAGKRAGRSCRTMAREVAAGTHLSLTGKFRKISSRSLQRWVVAYKKRGLAGLEPIGRKSLEASLVLSPKLIDFAISQKEKDPSASIPELIRRAQALGVILPEENVCRSTLYRQLKRQGVNVRRRRAARDRDSRRFAYPHRMQMVLSDGKHFRAGAKRLKRVAMFFLDNASRFGLRVVVGPSETSKLFLRGVYLAISHYGLPDAYYLDKGSAFLAHDTTAVLAKLGITHLQGEVRYPEGHGMIERFHRTVIADLLRHLDRNPEVDPDCQALELRLQHYLDEVYNQRVHSSLEGLCPAERFEKDQRSLRFPADLRRFKDCFKLYERRRVSADHVVTVKGVGYEMPQGHAGELVTVKRHLLEETVHFVHQGKLIELRPVPLEENARSKRVRRIVDETPVGPLPPSAAELAFTRSFRCAVDADGGFKDRKANLTPDKQEGDDPK